MSNIEEFPSAVRRPTEYEPLAAGAPGALDAIPGAVYLCDHEGRVTHYNNEAAELWGRLPGRDERFCGSHRLFRLDGTSIRHDECPMAQAVKQASRPGTKKS